MDLLPKSREDFTQTEYWNSFFKKRGEKTFEWYGEYLELCGQIHKYIRPSDNILMLGCGNSKLSEDMYDAGFRNITNIDTSNVAIKNMQTSNFKKRPNMKFLQMDATAMTFEDEAFSVEFDKATLDSLFVDDTEEVLKVVQKYFEEILRTIRYGGRYLCVTLLQAHILKYMINFFSAHSCMIRVVHVSSPETNNGVKLPVFFVIITKFKQLVKPILEFGLTTEKMQRIEKAEDLTEAVAAIQKAALICNGLAHNSIAGSSEVTLDLHQPGKNEPRYTVHILDQPPARGLGKFAVFLVPMGREIEWLFSTPDGRKKLQDSAKFKRLAVVSMHRDQIYDSLEKVKGELGDSIKNLAPYGLTEQIPFLSLGSDVGKRETLVSGSSAWSGDYRVEEVEGVDGKLLRRLIFLNNQSVVQSEALVRIAKGKNKRKRIDIGYLACEHHKYMSVGAQLTQNAESKELPKNSTCIKDVLVVGLGGGGLCSFLRAALPKARVTAVEIDPIMLEIAENYFDLKLDERLHVVIDDGVDFLERCRNEDIHFNAVLFDVDSKNLSLGMSCPPQQFLESNVLANVLEIIGKEGIFILNLVCRDEKLRTDALENLHKTFTAVCCYKLDEDINEIIYCSNNEKYSSIEIWKKSLEIAVSDLNASLIKQKLRNDELMLGITEFLDELKICTVKAAAQCSALK